MADDEAEAPDRGGTDLRARAPERRPVVRFDPRQTGEDGSDADGDEPVAEDEATDEQTTPEPGEGVSADAARVNGDALERPPAGAVGARPPEVTPPASVRAARLAESMRETGREATRAARDAVSRAVEAARDRREPATRGPTPPPTPTQPRGDGALVPHLDGGEAPLAERMREGRRRVREATRRAMARTAELAGAFEVPFREDAEEPATRGPTPPPTPTQPRGRGPLVPGLAAEDHDGFRVLAVRPAGEAFADEELAPVLAPEPEAQAPVPAPPADLTATPTEAPEPAPTPPPRQPLEAAPAPPPAPTLQAPEEEAPDEDEPGLIARLIARFGSSEDDEAEEPEQEPAEADGDEEEASGGLLSRLRERFAGDGDADEPDQEPAEAREDGAAGPQPPPSPPAGEDRVPATVPGRPPRLEDARPNGARDEPPSPPVGDDRLPARLPSVPDRAPAPEQARPGDAERGPTPAPPAAETPVPAQASLTPAPDDGDEAPEPEPAPSAARERTVPEDLHERIDEVLDEHEQEPGRVLEGDRR